jgi:hypothetical protein
MHDLKTWNQYLITNFRHWSTHKAKYLAGCQSEQVEPNQRIMSAVTKTGEGIKEQGSLEGWTIPKAPLWSKEGLMEHIIELVVVDDQVRQQSSSIPEV